MILKGASTTTHTCYTLNVTYTKRFRRAQVNRIAPTARLHISLTTARRKMCQTVPPRSEKLKQERWAKLSSEHDVEQVSTYVVSYRTIGSRGLLWSIWNGMRPDKEAWHHHTAHAHNERDLLRSKINYPIGQTHVCTWRMPVAEPVRFCSSLGSPRFFKR